LFVTPIDVSLIDMLLDDVSPLGASPVDMCVCVSLT